MAMPLLLAWRQAQVEGRGAQSWPQLKIHNALRALYLQCQLTQVCLLQQNGLTLLFLSQLLPSTPQQDSLELSPTAYGSGP